MQLWFMVLMAAVALILFGISLGVGLHRALTRPPYARERPPLIPMPLQPRSPRGIYPTSNAYLVVFNAFECVNVFHPQFDSVPDTSSSPNTITLKAFTMRMEEVIDCKGVENSDAATGSQLGTVTVSTVHTETHAVTQNPLRRSVTVQAATAEVGSMTVFTSETVENFKTNLHNRLTLHERSEKSR
ncbi:Usherin [Bagarius yarrelli]|uniref:Usherin n=1 Tax=Bagarius yarrelli TaxID=175774 RepID=A0A556VWK3_BAGYA|nr:Usherin [Bagarius yarrelli]